MEQSCPLGYVRPIFLFDLSEVSVDYEKICEPLQTSLNITKQAVPMLAAVLEKNLDAKQKGLHKLVPSENSGKLHLRDLRGNEFPSYEELKEKHFPPSDLPQELLCPLPIFPEKADGIPVFAAQATLIDGGLVLNLCVIHVVADARAIFEIFKIWAQNFRHLQDPQIPICQQLPAYLFEKQAFTGMLGSRTAPTDSTRPVMQHPDYVVHSSPPPPPPAIMKTSFRTKVFRFSKSGLQQLKRDVAAGLENDQYISTNDAICALIWCCVLAAQIDTSSFSPDALSLNTICVDGRARCSGRLSENHIGCPMFYAIPRLRVEQILGVNGLTKASLAIRSAINAVNEAAIADLVSFLNHIPDYDCLVPVSFNSLMDTGVMMSSWFQLPFSDVNWGSMFGSGRCDCVRTVHEGFFNGSQIIMPKLASGGMDVVVGLDKSKWLKFEDNMLWKRYTSQ